MADTLIPTPVHMANLNAALRHFGKWVPVCAVPSAPRARGGGDPEEPCRAWGQVGTAPSSLPQHPPVTPHSTHSSAQPSRKLRMLLPRPRSMGREQHRR